MEPTESAAAGSRLRLRRMAGAWHASRWFGRRDGGAPSPAADARGCAPPATARASAPPPTGRGGPPASHTGQDSAPPPTGQGAPRSSTGHVSAPSATGHTPAASTTGPVPTRPAGGRGPASRAPGRGPRGRIPGPGAAPSRPGPAPVGTDADGERHLPWPALPSAVVAAASFVLGAGFYRAFTDGQALFPSGTAGWALAVLTGIVVGHLVMLGRSRWWGGTGSGAALTLAVLLLYGWVPAGMVSLTVVVLVGIARRGRWRHGVLHGAVDILGIAAGATLLGVCGSVPSVEEPWDPATWGVYAAPKVVLVAVAYLAVTRALLWYLQTPRAGLPTVARTALVRQGLVAVALLGIAPLVCVVAVAKPLLLPLFAIPLIALDSTLWIARARAEEQLRDPLTGLPNRQWLLERTWTALDDAERIGARAALMLIDLDRFRSVNDTLGHLAGDRLLLQTADRLRQALPRGAEAARLGGDEFAVLLPVADSTTSATRIARGLVGALGSPMDLDGLTLVLEASAGVAVFPDHALDAEGLLRRADVAMYQAKRDRTGVEVYESKRDSNTPDRLGLLGDLRRALDAHEVQLHYQPKVRFDGQVAGLEALVRWVHPERGKVPPDEFIAIAESSGLMPHLTEYVLETALEQVAHWRSQGLFVPVAVNVSPRDVHTPGFAGSVAARLARHGVPAGALQLEITEHVLLEDPQRAADTLNALTGHGVKMSLDDFGTGYSSLVHLRRLPVSELKIDRSFVARLAVDTEDAEIVRCTVDLAHSLGLLVVAEGVEDDETWERLRDLGCDAVQGWLVAAAMPPEETTAWLLARGARGWQRPAAALPAAAADDQGRLG
ncbi:EAL domain-containing protein [Streptomyces sp. WAC04189]|uniref:putative bifunctional diguanylate cyclase/phosphodiesterase n=1 Tax=Streptomyces TaxID=1883 RepID=UPI000FC335FD|nr:MULTISPECIES: bifunctional diguanylate cyclase/phosphodiesterase [unclassified Streptomyces]QCR49692.1 GGDEF-domain containing protein [Streptomyces sp. SGAir0924]RSS00147.1 EAL domain-containing protein [Streptomyces sp. WAC04189]UAX56053.1 EAL domain-containing protein [Streptomyces sp. A144]